MCGFNSFSLLASARTPNLKEITMALPRGRSASKRRGFKEKARDKQIKPRREEEKECVVPETKTDTKIVDHVENPTPRQKMLFERYGVWYD